MCVCVCVCMYTVKSHYINHLGTREYIKVREKEKDIFKKEI